jgi:3-hydroxyacyl-[acyl-carrier-protein] dehydratase
MTGRTKRRGLGPDTLRLLLPHGRPFLFVDRVLDYQLGEAPELHACRHISHNEPVFEGHFPGWSLWPGVYTIEGMGQAAQLLSILLTIERAGDELGDPEFGLRALEAMDAERRGRPTTAPDPGGMSLLRQLRGLRALGLATRVDVRLTEPVLAGSLLEYRVAILREIDGLVTYTVRAEVKGAVVARGELGASGNVSLPSME